VTGRSLLAGVAVPGRSAFVEQQQMNRFAVPPADSVGVQKYLTFLRTQSLHHRNQIPIWKIVTKSPESLQNHLIPKKGIWYYERKGKYRRKAKRVTIKYGIEKFC